MIKVVDFFSGCGGTSAGFKAAGLSVVAAIDVDKDAKLSYKANFPKTKFFRRDIRWLKTKELLPFVTRDSNDVLLFCACAPCQPFSIQSRQKKKHDKRASLLAQFGRFVKYYHPELIFIENVPGLQKISSNSPLEDFKSLLDELGYKSDIQVINCRDYGIPQKRMRLVLIASSLGEIKIPEKTHGKSLLPYATAWEWIGGLPKIAAGGSDLTVANHQAASLSNRNLQRIHATPEGGSRADWPRKLWLKCHKTVTGHSDVYGRIRKYSTAPAMTTRCISLSNGRFGHPVQDRALSVREAACLQTFPLEFIFHGSLSSMARQIGNAVPFELAKKFGTHFNSHVLKFHGKV